MLETIDQCLKKNLVLHKTIEQYKNKNYWTMYK